MNNHTPGPWDVDEDERGPFVCNGETRNMIADTSSCGHLSFSEIKANTTLIAAAPDLLAVLEELLPEIARCCDEGFTSRYYYDDLKAVIAKARGNQ